MFQEPFHPSQGIVDSLQQLEQFLPVRGEDAAICALSGVYIAVVDDVVEAGHGMIELTFPCAAPVQAIEALYLKLRIIESVRLAMDFAEHSDTLVSRRAHELLEHFQGKYGL